MVYSSASTALANARDSMFTLTSAGFVGFAIFDVPISDNRGGVSLEVLQMASPPTAVPEPGLLGLFAIGVALWGIQRRRLRV